MTTSVICDHTCWPQWLPKMLFRRCFREFLIVLCVFVHGLSSYLHCEWATEQQLEKDKRIQQKIKRFKMKQAQRALFFADVRLCDCVRVDILYTAFVYSHIVNIWYEQVCVFTICCLLGCVHKYCVCVWKLNILFVFCLCGQAHLCAYIRISLLALLIQ